jgi:DNA-binding NarL/FixJ family response regulator
MNNIRLTIVENDKLIANLLRDFLSEIPNFEVAHLFYDGASFLENLESSTLTDILLIDLKMPNVSGVDVIEEIKRQGLDIKIVVLSSFYDPNYLGFVFKLGVNAFLPKEIDKDALIQVIQAVHENGYYFDQNQMQVLQEQMRSKVSNIPLDKKDALTSREIEVLKLICHQMTAKEIGEKLFISTKTVETHKSNLLYKTGARNISGLIIFAAQNGFIDPDEILL